MSETNAVDQKFIVFRLGDEEYTIPVEFIGSIERILPITRVPGTPRFVKGVINLRGVVTPVLDLKQKIKGIQTEFTEETRIIIVNNKEFTVGIIVDRANDVIDIDVDQIEAPPETVGTTKGEFINGVIKQGDRLFISLKLEEIFKKDNVEKLAAMEG